MPKLHKITAEHSTWPIGCPARLIVSATNHPCEPLSDWIHRTLRPVLSRTYLPEYLRDTPDFLLMLEDVREGSHTPLWECSPVTTDSTPFSIDVDSMFPTIPFDKGADCCGMLWQRLRQNTDPTHPLTPAL